MASYDVNLMKVFTFANKINIIVIICPHMIIIWYISGITSYYILISHLIIFQEDKSPIARAVRGHIFSFNITSYYISGGQIPNCPSSEGCYNMVCFIASCTLCMLLSLAYIFFLCLFQRVEGSRFQTEQEVTLQRGSRHRRCWLRHGLRPEWRYECVLQPGATRP